MRYDLLEKYSSLDSVIHRLNPKTKILVFIPSILIVVSTPPDAINKFIIYSAVIFSLIHSSRIPPSFILKRSLVVLPFVLLVIISVPFMKENSFLILWNVLIKSWLSVLLMVLLTSTTSFQRLLKGFQELKMPEVIILIISFMYRYIYITADEITRMRRARDSRTVEINRRQQFSSGGYIIGSLFIKSFERGERIYQAMLSRAYAGEIKTLSREKFSVIDYAFTSIYLAIAALLVFM